MFRFPAGETVIRALNDSIPDGWNLTEWNRRADTALLWLTPGVPDTLWLEISDSEQIFDTLRILTTPIVPASKSKKAQEPVKKLNIASNIRSGQLDPFKPFILTFGNPVSRYSFSGIVLMTETDTLAPAAAFTDSTNRMMEITYPWKESGKCSIIIPDSIFFGLDGTSHDSLTFYFTIRSLDSYGNITLNVSHSDTTSGYIIQLVTEKDAVVREYFTGQSAGERIDFSNLDPGKYRLKAIYDRNRNHRWDTGKYLMHLAPEKVAYFDKTLEIRANWISEESWILE